MPKKGIKFIPEYLIPSLNNKRFGNRLKWIDKNKKLFEIEWRHKAGPEWTEQEAAVFVEWDKHKGHFNPSEKQYYTNSKQRFRALLYKLTLDGQLKKLKSATKFKKVFCIGQKKNSRRKKSDLNAENESCNEELSTGEQEYEETGDIYCRPISEANTKNVLDDHSYSITENCQDNCIDMITYGENQQVINSQDACVPVVLSESPDNIQKRILMERNYGNLDALMPTLCTESLLSCSDYGLANTVLMPAGKLPMEPNLPAYQTTSFNGNNPFADTLGPLETIDVSELLGIRFNT